MTYVPFKNATERLAAEQHLTWILEAEKLVISYLTRRGIEYDRARVDAYVKLLWEARG